METSQYISYIQRFFTGAVNGIVTTLNGVNSPLPYYHKRFLTKTYSVDGKWESINAANTAVMADVVAMDSSLPLKKRDSISKASGDIPKMGMELALRENQLTQLQTLALRPGTEPQLIQAIFQDIPRVITGVMERERINIFGSSFYRPCSHCHHRNTGTEIRIDYGVPSGNKTGVATVWSNTASTPLTDLQAVQTTARNAGNIIQKFLMDRTAFNNMAKTDQVKNYHGFNLGFTGTAIAIPNFTQVNNYAAGKFRLYNRDHRKGSEERKGWRSNRPNSVGHRCGSWYLY
jgi:hypothetical protein